MGTSFRNTLSKMRRTPTGTISRTVVRIRFILILSAPSTVYCLSILAHGSRPGGPRATRGCETGFVEKTIGRASRGSACRQRPARIAPGKRPDRKSVVGSQLVPEIGRAHVVHAPLPVAS